MTIGGIHAGNLRSIVEAGAAGAAVIAAVCEAQDMVGATEELKKTWESVVVK